MRPDFAYDHRGQQSFLRHAAQIRATGCDAVFRAHQPGADAVPGSPASDGRAAVQAFWQSGFDQGAYDLVLESPEIKSLGDRVSYEIGRNIVRVRTADGSSIDVPGKSLCIFRREGDGVWRADVDIFNSIKS